MKKNNAFLCVVLMCFMLTLTGCGEQMISLTEDEANAIALYSAKVVSVYNTDQQIGLCNAKISDEELGRTSTTDSYEIVQENQPEEAEDLGLDDVGPEIAEVVSSQPDSIETGYSLSEAVGIDGVEFAIDYFVIDDIYSATDHFVLTAGNGCQYVIFTIKAKNTTADKIDINISPTDCKFICEIDDQSRSVAQTTILDNDLSAYRGSISAGESKDFVLLFQYKSSVLERFSKVNLLVDKDGVVRSTGQ